LYYACGHRTGLENGPDAFPIVKKANPLSEKSKGARYPHSRTDTMIGAGMRVEGHLAFSGVLRIEGDALGDVSCEGDSGGMVVVGKTGNVAGRIRVPHIVVAGHVSGPLHSSESIEIQQGACVVGDVFYRAIDLHAGGVVEGSLTPNDAMEGDRLRQARPGRGDVPPSAAEFAMPPAAAAAGGSRLGAGFAGARRLGAAVALLVALVAGVLMSRDPAPIAPPATEVAPKPEAATSGIAATPPVPVSAGSQPDASPATAGDAPAPVPNPVAGGRSAANASPAELPAADSDQVVTVQGVNPAKPGGVVLVIGKEPSVLIKKKRQDPAEGTRIDVAQGATESIAIARGEILRVAQGRDLTIFYQGRKVTPKTIESGVWMSFVPQSPSPANGKD